MTDQGLTAVVRASVAALAPAETDAAAARLAVTYAERIDAGEPMDKIGPALLAVLESLGMTPRARSAITKGVPNAVQPVNPLDELKQRRAARATG